jgi:hypothetical protein
VARELEAGVGLIHLHPTALLPYHTVPHALQELVGRRIRQRCTRSHRRMMLGSTLDVVGSEVHSLSRCLAVSLSSCALDIL